MADTKLLDMLEHCIQRLESEGYSCRAERDALWDYSNTSTPPADAALADDAIIELVTDYAQSKVRAESCRYHYESKEYDKEAADTLEQIRAALRALAVPEELPLFDAAIAVELPRVSVVPYNSKEICTWFAKNVRERMLTASKAGG